MSTTQADSSSSPDHPASDGPTDPPAASSGEAVSPPRRRWQVWRSPTGQPRWARPALLVIAAVTGLLFASMLRNPGYAPFYSVAVKSMSMSWTAFFYGAIDPGATVTLDKLAGSLLPQALSARIFGYHAWSLALPQVIEGVVTVLVLYRVVRLWCGEVAGLLAAGIFGLTPVVTSMFGHAMADGALTMCLVLAVDCYQRAVNHARLRPLLLAGVWVGVGFQCKMLQAWMILPALTVGYLVLAPTTLRRRLGHLATAGVVMVTVSASWILLYELTPAENRPYVAGTTNNSAFTMVVGFNGLGRLGIDLPGARAGDLLSGPSDSGPGAGSPDGPPVNGKVDRPGDHDGGPPPILGGAPPGAGEGGGWSKLLYPDSASQTGWLYPLALLSLVLGLWWHRGVGRSDRLRGGFLMWGVWLATAALVFTMIPIPHRAYLATLSIPLAALAGGGIVLAWRAYRAGGAPAWALPVVVAAETAWTIYLSWSYPDFLPWLLPLVGLAGGVAVSVMALALIRPAIRDRARNLVAGALAVGVGAMLLTPSAWAASVLDLRYAGTAFDAGAGPVVDAEEMEMAADFSRATLNSRQRRLLDYMLSHGDGATYAFATNSWSTASPYIAFAGAKVLPIGGFDGATPVPTLGQAKNLVATGELRFVLISSENAARGPTGATVADTVNQITDWVEATCTEVPVAAYIGAGRPDVGDQRPTAPPRQATLLYECTQDTLR